MKFRKHGKNLDELLGELKSKKWSVKAAAAKNLGWKQDKRAILPLIKAANDEKEEVREMVLWALSNIMLVHPKNSDLQKGKPVFKKMLKEKNWYLRCHAATLVGGIKSVDSIPDLIHFLGDEYIEVRNEVAGALGRMKSDISPRQIKKIQSMLEGNKKERHGAMVALEMVGHPNMMTILQKCMKDNESRIREDAVEIIGQKKTKQATSFLISALDDIDGNVREKAIKALVKRRDKKTVPALVKALKDDYWVVQIEAAEGLGELGDKKALPALLEIVGEEEIKEDSEDPWEMVRAEAQKAIKNIKSRKR